MVTKVEQFIQIMESKIKDVEIDLTEFKKGEFNTILKTRLYALNELLAIYKKLNDR